MKFSIITCTWNSEQWLPDSIASVSAQRDADIERIFVDGGSTDRTLDIIAAVPGNVKFVRDIRNGISNAMNEGVKAATGDVIAHLHSDDVYVDGSVLSTVQRGFESAPSARWLYGRCRWIVQGQFVDNHFESKRFSWGNLIRGNIIPHPATFIRRDLFNESGGFSTGLKYVMDYDLWLRLGRRHTPVQLDDYLAAFRFHDGSLSTRDLWPCHAESKKVRMEYASRNPLERLEHHARHAWRSMRVLANPLR